MDTWSTNNSTPGASHNWWVKARAVSTETATWHSQWTTEALSNTSDAQTVGSVGNICNQSLPASGWETDAASGADADACLDACRTLNLNQLTVNPDTSGPTVDNGGQTFAAWESTPHYCGAISWDNS